MDIFHYRDPSTDELQHVSASALEWRVADACNRAVLPRMSWSGKPPRWLDEGRVDFQLVSKLCWKLSLLGLAPDDLDNPEGHAAIHAIADAIMCDSEHPTIAVTHDEFCTTLPAPEWLIVTRAAQHLLWRQPRRYEVDQKPG